MNRAIEALGRPLYGSLRLLLGTAARCYYRSIEVRHRERVPASGPVLVVANHPASLTDVLVLATAIPRRLHFVAYSGLFRPWLLGFVLRLAGTVPVYRREDDAARMHLNAGMFQACHELLDAGGVVLIFPEGTSQSDRKVEKLKTGAARLALAHTSRPGRAESLVLLPIGVHFAERTMFRSPVELSVGRPVDLSPFLRVHAADPTRAVRELTDALQVALEKLILNVPSPDLAGLVHDVERIYLEELRAVSPAAPDLALVRGVADSIEYFLRTDPPRMHALWRDVSAYRRKLAALDLRDPALRASVTHAGAASGRMAAVAVLGAAPALIGGAVHWVPYRLSGTIGGWFSRDPTRIAFSRILSGVVLFPATYAILAWVLLGTTGWGPAGTGFALAACVPLGFYSLGYFRWLRRERHRLHMLLVAAANRRMLARLRHERKQLVRRLDEARADYIAAKAPLAADAVVR